MLKKIVLAFLCFSASSLCAHNFSTNQTCQSNTDQPPCGNGVMIEDVVDVLKNYDSQKGDSQLSRVISALSSDIKPNQVIYIYPDVFSADAGNLYLKEISNISDTDTLEVKNALRKLSLDLSEISPKTQFIIMPLLSSDKKIFTTSDANNIVDAIKGLPHVKGVAFDIEDPKLKADSLFMDKLLTPINKKWYIAAFDAEAYYKNNKSLPSNFIALRSTYDMMDASKVTNSHLSPSNYIDKDSGIATFFNNPPNNPPADLNVQFVLPATGTTLENEAVAVFNTYLAGKTVGKTTIPSLKSSFCSSPIPSPLKIFPAENNQNLYPQSYYKKSLCYLECGKYCSYSDCTKNSDPTPKTFYQSESNINYCSFSPSLNGTLQSQYVEKAMESIKSHISSSKFKPNILGYVLYSLKPKGFWAVYCSKHYFNSFLGELDLLKVMPKKARYPEDITQNVLNAFNANL
jgi:hypothetical protein